jgi:hypothetical protein
MPLILKDRIKETTAVTGTGTATLLGAVVGYQSFSDIGNGNTCYYTIVDQTTNAWEVGVGTYNSPNQLARTTVLSSSNSGSPISFSAGTKDVFVVQPAGEAVYINQATNKVEAFGNGANTISFTNVTADLFTGNASAISAINASNVSSGTIDNARTTAASANGASTIVARDANGSFTANTITATTVNATSGNFTNITGNGVALTAINASNISSGTLANDRTTASDANGASTIVLRDANGSFTANAGTFTSISGNGIALTAINASNISSGTIANARTTGNTANSANTLVLRDASGNFAANEISGEEILATNGLFVNNMTVASSFSVPAGYSASSVGPVTVGSGASVTLPSGSRWVVL